MTDVSDQIAQLTQVYLKGLPDKLSAIENEVVALCRGDLEALQRAYKKIHEIAGSAGCFGLPELSAQAAAIEKDLLVYLQDKKLPPQDLLNDVSDRVAELGKKKDPTLATVKEPADKNSNVSESIPITSKHKAKKKNSKTNKDSCNICVLEDDKDFGELIITQLNQIGYNAALFDNVSEFERSISVVTPDVIIVDAMLNEGDFSGFHAIKELKSKQDVNIPLIAISSRSDFESRLEAVKAGADFYFVKPVSIDEISLAIEVINDTANLDTNFRILIIDDDIELSKHFSLILENAGMQVKSLPDPTEALDTIALYDPELILTDLNMPVCSGVELAKIIRFHIEYMHIPIVFLSTESRLDEHRKALEVGGDEFLTKPIKPDVLVNSVLTRVRRARQISDLVHQDSLTGLLKHTAIRDALEREMMRSKRTGQSIIFAMIDLDHFKNVNDTYGHLVGDQVIKRMSQMLKLRFRSTDYVARYGGEEFAVLLSDCSLDDAMQLFQDLRKSFEQLNFKSKEISFNVTCSIGFAMWNRKDSVDQLCDKADKALYKAKELGRNQVIQSNEAE